jgi:polyphenol oxidase
MHFHQPDSVRYLTFDSLDEAGFTHAVFTRQGGVSPAPWSTLNVGGTVGDDPNRVMENRRRSLNALNRSELSLFEVWQVHGAEVICAVSPRHPNDPHQKADVILTDSPEITLFMRFADCVPVLLADPIKNVAGIVHAGWQGTLRKASLAAVDVMQAKYGSQVDDIIAAIGPSICPSHYQVGQDVIDGVYANFGIDSPSLLISQDGAVQFDLWTANRHILEEAGVRRIESLELCTACNLDDWYSHRAEKGRTGRFGILIAAKG